jgi:nitroimidazol reductase NimA-like FMN-containing flavoprotein (pyridoxamine 5'-phosphate oxidase superfamily)
VYYEKKEITMERIKKLDQEQILYVFRKDQCKDLKEDYLILVKDTCKWEHVEGCLIKHYGDDFESLLKHKIPSKIRMPAKLLSYRQCQEVMRRIQYGVLSITCEEFPYCVGINHILLDGRIFFHCAKNGFKLNGVDKRASFLITEDLGINLNVGTHNHRSVAVFGTLRKVEDVETKKAALLTLIHDLAPKHPYHDNMVTTTNILEIEVDYMIGKAHIF